MLGIRYTNKSYKSKLRYLSDILYEVFNRPLMVDTFPSSMKLANVTPVYKKSSRWDKGNLRPVSMLLNLSKVFEKCVIFDEIHSKYYCGFRRGHGAQHCLIALLENWCILVLIKVLNLEHYIRIFPRLFDCLKHSFLLPKLFADELDTVNRDCKQRTKI